jgi:hypothetical protein
MIEALDGFGINKITNLFNCMYDSCHTPNDLTTSIFIALSKRVGVTECEQHRTISLISRITKLLLRIIIARIINKLKPAISKEQCGLKEGKSTTDASYILRNTISRNATRPILMLHRLHKGF